MEPSAEQAAAKAFLFLGIEIDTGAFRHNERIGKGLAKLRKGRLVLFDGSLFSGRSQGTRGRRRHRQFVQAKMHALPGLVFLGFWGAASGSPRTGLVLPEL